MAFEYKNFFQFTYNGTLYGQDPYLDCPVPDGHEHFGVKLYTLYGMPEADAKAIHDAEVLRQVRAYRDKLIAETDWWVLPDRNPTQAQLDYRQALRDTTNNYSSLDDVVWPEKPEA